MNDSRFKDLPSVSRCLEHESIEQLISQFGQGAVTWSLRKELDKERGLISSSKTHTVSSLDDLTVRTKNTLTGVKNNKHIINATGIILHTGLGRAPLSTNAKESLSKMDRYSLVELDLESGERSKRDATVSELLKEITGAPDSTVVNNNAAATFLILHTLAFGKEIIVSRGQLIEIGGSYRLPDIMESGGTKLKEVGTTNRTHLADYEKAINSNTGLIIHVHTSNYEITGFTSSPTLAELVELGKKHNIPVVDDMGSGALFSLETLGLPSSPTVQQSLKAGADLVCYSGDKLIGGPQAGIISGKAELVEKMRKSPFYRMFRVDKLCLSALHSTLLDFMSPETLKEKSSVYQLAARSISDLREFGESLKIKLSTINGLEISIIETEAFLGGGSLPGQALQSLALELTSAISAKEIAKRLRLGSPSVVARIAKDKVLLDLKTIFPDEAESLFKVCQTAFQ